MYENNMNIIILFKDKKESFFIENSTSPAASF